jgi:hypothetical protein
LVIILFFLGTEASEIVSGLCCSLTLELVIYFILFLGTETRKIVSGLDVPN